MLIAVLGLEEILLQLLCSPLHVISKEFQSVHHLVPLDIEPKNPTISVIRINLLPIGNDLGNFFLTFSRY